MIRWWPLYGLKKKLTEQREYLSSVKLRLPTTTVFKRSLFVYIIDVGSSNALNFEISALEAPQYNMHRFGIYWTDSPRHADVLLILGHPVKAMINPLKETLSQLPQPFYTITIDDNPQRPGGVDYPALPNHIAAITGVPSPSQILGLFLDIAKTKRKQS
ncbi:NADH:ubiquinone oxidoreductase [Candidatus Sulfidibacterium hydrothermale]|uniref:NADH:ubiquinone oxidoreductase n=1 Tax=Candidatus Sulfidibacterium hydrothermale TaxID=2875962 RepID=UPI001F0B6BE1|nr:NADH:ubiquinone oxidoreductase [Candidatus Sulfidibacterium hydrothermale]UBM63129.1 NADH:ubiquinone oxidoreductase [Candidatus Sulfidibacterium hydrothermale]